jgi:alginate O-acetyltransferase complex protein AlgI
MLFNSFHFLVFFIVVTLTYFFIPNKYRILLLLLSSCYFYMVFVPVYILILAFTIIIDYYAGIFLEKFEGNKRKWFLIASLVANIGVLAFFKYYNFFLSNTFLLLHGIGYKGAVPYLSILLPIGLSFHTFQAMSYTIEVYRGNQKAEKRFDVYALYVMFYPQLVAGPIERPQHIIWQLKKEYQFNYSMVISGLRLMLWGAFKKIVIADRLAPHVNEVYDHLSRYSGFSLALATVFFSIQIFCDFSGYSDIAIGCARVMGINLMKNFDRPYSSKNFSEFWRRWHISLSSWFRDYLYFPLGGNRVSNPRLYFNLLFVFLISGLWHGASWNFVIWGGLHGAYLVITILTEKSRSKFIHYSGLDKVPVLLNILNVILVFSLTTFAWIFFRAKTFKDALYVITHLFHSNGLIGIGSLTINDFFLVTGSIAVMEFVQYYHAKNNIVLSITRQPVFIRWAVYSTIAMAILFLGNFGSEKFIYFQF